MRKDTKKLFVGGLFFLFLALVTLVFYKELNNYGNNTALIASAVCMLISIIAFSISANLVGKGDFLLLDNLKSGNEYILIDHITVNGSRKFSLVSKPDLDKFVTIHGDDRLFDLRPEESFILINRTVRKLS